MREEKRRGQKKGEEKKCNKLRRCEESRGEMAE